VLAQSTFFFLTQFFLKHSVVGSWISKKKVKRHVTYNVIFIGKVAFICLVGSVNSVLKILGQPGETQFQPGVDEISSGFPMSFNTKLTEPKGK